MSVYCFLCLKVQKDDNKKRTLDLVCTQIHHFVRMKAAFHNRHKNDANVKISNVKTLYQTSRGRIKSRLAENISKQIVSLPNYLCDA